MANGHTHAIAANITIVAGGILAFAQLPPSSATVLTAGLVIGRFANPDVRDQASIRNEAEHAVGRLAGHGVGWVWTAYWWPLAAMIPHRHWLSHFPVVATAVAWLWLFVPMLLLLSAVYPPADAVLIPLVASGYLFAGWVAQDFVHLVLDRFGIRWKW